MKYKSDKNYPQKTQRDDYDAAPDTTITDTTITGTRLDNISTNLPWSYSNHSESGHSITSVKDLLEAIELRKNEVSSSIKNYINEDLDKKMAIDIVKQIIKKFRLNVNELRAEIITEEI
jgi:hypothetical protein